MNVPMFCIRDDEGQLHLVVVAMEGPMLSVAIATGRVPVTVFVGPEDALRLRDFLCEHMPALLPDEGSGDAK